MDLSFIWDYKEEFITGFFMTVSASILALIIATVLGIVLATFRITPNKMLNAVSLSYIEFTRNIPLLVIVFFFYYALPIIGIKCSEFVTGVIGIAFYNASFIAEIVRSGIESVPKGQMEAARSTGLSYIQALQHVVLPQAIRKVIPPFGNQFLYIVKGTGILTVIAGGDLMYHADIVASDTFLVFNVYLFVAVLYLLITIPLSMAVTYLEKRLTLNH